LFGRLVSVFNPYTRYKINLRMMPVCLCSCLRLFAVRGAPIAMGSLHVPSQWALVAFRANVTYNPNSFSSPLSKGTPLLYT